MKPVYLHESEVPQSLKDQAINEAPSEQAKAKAVEKLYAREVLLD